LIYGQVRALLHNVKISWRLNSVNVLGLAAASGVRRASKPTLREPSVSSSSGNWLGANTDIRQKLWAKVSGRYIMTRT